jgi:hypothetical protein
MHIAECLAERRRISSIHRGMEQTDEMAAQRASGDQEEQEHKTMVETVHQLYERLSQNGAPALAMMASVLIKMAPMNFQVTQEAAAFATEAHIHHMCTVVNLTKTCCFEALAYDLFTNLGPERFTEWKAALINEAAVKVPHLFRMLEADVRKGNFQPRPGS